MNCYKCGSTENLSVKKTDRQGNKVYMCRNCRYLQMGYIPGKKREPVPEFKLDPDPIDPVAWNIKAKESHQRILARLG